MAAKKTKKTEVVAEVIDSTNEPEVEVQDESSETIAIACSLPFGLKFTDIPNGKGGTKTIILPGVNHALKGKASGILALPGNAVCVTLLKSDWEALVKIHGKEDAFIGRNGRIPCIYPVGNRKGFKSARSEIAEMKHGLEPITPKSAEVKENTSPKA